MSLIRNSKRRTAKEEKGRERRGEKTGGDEGSEGPDGRCRCEKVNEGVKIDEADS